MEDFRFTLSALNHCWKAQLLLLLGPIIAALILWVGVDLVATLNFEGVLKPMLQQIQLGIWLFMCLLAVAAIVASCVFAYVACKKHIEQYI